MGPINSSFGCISPFGFHTGKPNGGRGQVAQPGFWSLGCNVCPCVLQTGQGSYLLPFGLRAVCEAQQVTEPMGGSHLSEQLRSCLREWSGSSQELGWWWRRWQWRRRRRKKSGRASGCPVGSEEASSGPRQGCGQVVRSQGWVWLAGICQAPVVGCEDQDLLWGGGSCGDMENQGRGRGGTQRCHVGRCQPAGE